MDNPLFERSGGHDDPIGSDDNTKSSHDDFTQPVVVIPSPTALPTAEPTAAFTLTVDISFPPPGAATSSSTMFNSDWAEQHHTGLPFDPSTFWTRPSPTTIPTQTADPTPYSDYHSTSAGTPTPIYTDLPGPSSTGANNGDDGSGEFQRKSSNHAGLYAAGGVIPVVIIAILAVALFFYLRKRKQKKDQAALAVGAQEMVKTRNSAYLLPVAQQPSPGTPPPPGSQPYYASAALPPSNPTPLRSPSSPQPVILGPIVSGSNGAYYTGIDTSDVVSITGAPPPQHTQRDRTGLGNPFVDGDSINEEPPPPYRPTSLPPLSRDTSLRAPPAAHSREHLIPRHDEQPAHSPFADPPRLGVDDDAVSVLEDGAQTGRRREVDNMSAVSDLSYQADPVISRPSV